MTRERIWTAALVVIGDEILSGRTQDKNVAQLATWLNLQGIRLSEVRIVADDMARIVQWVHQNHPEVLGEVAQQYQANPNILQTLLGNKALMATIAQVRADEH